MSLILLLEVRLLECKSVDAPTYLNNKLMLGQGSYYVI